MTYGKDGPSNRRMTDQQDSTDRGIEETLRQIGAEILEEPVPERLRRLLRPTKDRSDEEKPEPEGR